MVVKLNCAGKLFQIGTGVFAFYISYHLYFYIMFVKCKVITERNGVNICASEQRNVSLKRVKNGMLFGGPRSMESHDYDVKIIFQPIFS